MEPVDHVNLFPSFPEIFATFADQQLIGTGCLLLEDNISLHLLLNSDFIDLEKLQSLNPGDSGIASDSGNDFPVELNIKLIVQEIHAAGVIVRDAEIILGRQPDCTP